MSKTLVAYFSATGITAKVAKIISSAANADLFEIKPAIPYSAADLDWQDKNSRSSVEMNDKTSRPKIEDKVKDMSEYKTIFLGFPIWWYQAPRIIHNFLESYDFSGKTIIPFVTSGSSPLGKTEEILKQICPAAHWLPGRRFAANPNQDEVINWTKEHIGWQN